MDLLQQARAEIDTVDAEMAALFERRNARGGRCGALQGRDRQAGL